MEEIVIAAREPFEVAPHHDTVVTARDLLGAVLVHETLEGLVAGRIVETEAYTRDDPASHSHKGFSNRCAAMYGEPGTAYVYQTRHHLCFNVVTNAPGVGEAVLIRALEPLAGLDLMRARRGTEVTTKLTNGPANLAKAMGITLEHNGADLGKGPLRILRGTRILDTDIVQAPRIGISKAVERPWRFYIASSPFVSKSDHAAERLRTVA